MLLSSAAAVRLCVPASPRPGLLTSRRGAGDAARGPSGTSEPPSLLRRGVAEDRTSPVVLTLCGEMPLPPSPALPAGDGEVPGRVSPGLPGRGGEVSFRPSRALHGRGGETLERESPDSAVAACLVCASSPRATLCRGGEASPAAPAVFPGRLCCAAGLGDTSWVPPARSRPPFFLRNGGGEGEGEGEVAC